MKRIVWMLLVLAAGTAHAGAPVDFAQRLDAPLPLHATFRDEAGRRVQLGDYFGAQPVVLVLGYYLCANLCTTVMQGVLESARDTGLRTNAYEVVAVSIDPTETPAIAERKKVSYTPWLQHAAARFHLLTGDRQNIARLTKAAGFSYVRQPGRHGEQRFEHPAGFVVATPDGRIARYFYGVRFDSRDMRLALVEASKGRIGSPIDRIILRCSHFDEQAGRYTLDIMIVVRVVGSALALLLAWWLWRHRGGAR